MGLNINQILKSMMLKELWQGLGITLSYLFKPKITVTYPDEKTPLSPRFRGIHALRRDENGKERCVACKLCEAVCPAQAIYIQIDEKSQVENRRTKVYDIDLAKCIFCGFCQEACPVEAVVLTQLFEFTGRERTDLHWDKSRLLEHGENWKESIDRNIAADAKYQ